MSKKRTAKNARKRQRRRRLDRARESDHYKNAVVMLRLLDDDALLKFYESLTKGKSIRKLALRLAYQKETGRRTRKRREAFVFTQFAPKYSYTSSTTLYRGVVQNDH